ncbi:MAG TPA: hypothetical protein VFJ72_14240 [Rubrobacteraceae bacterium]|nr:hypothetical protein [Rubrobacteraceae bacterium]
MAEFGRELTLEDLPRPPLFGLAHPDGRYGRAEAEVGGQPATVAALFADRELAGEFSSGAAEQGLSGLAGLDPRELSGWRDVEEYALSGPDYVLVVSPEGAGLFHAGDVARVAAEKAGEIPLPLYVISDPGGEAPLVSVETGEGMVLVAVLFSAPERARAFRERAAHLDLPDRLAEIDDADGLRRHALVARRAGASHAVIDPEFGSVEAMPVEDLISWRP